MCTRFALLKHRGRGVAKHSLNPFESSSILSHWAPYVATTARYADQRLPTAPWRRFGSAMPHDETEITIQIPVCTWQSLGFFPSPTIAPQIPSVPIIAKQPFFKKRTILNWGTFHHQHRFVLYELLAAHGFHISNTVLKRKTNKPLFGGLWPGLPVDKSMFLSTWGFKCFLKPGAWHWICCKDSLFASTCSSASWAFTTCHVKMDAFYSFSHNVFFLRTPMTFCFFFRRGTLSNSSWTYARSSYKLWPPIVRKASTAAMRATNLSADHCQKRTESSKRHLTVPPFFSKRKPICVLSVGIFTYFYFIYPQTLEQLNGDDGILNWSGTRACGTQLLPRVVVRPRSTPPKKHKIRPTTNFNSSAGSFSKMAYAAEYRPAIIFEPDTPGIGFCCSNQVAEIKLNEETQTTQGCNP